MHKSFLFISIGFAFLFLLAGDHGGTGGPFRSEHREKGRGPVNGVERCRLLPGRKHRAVVRCARLRGLSHQNNATLRRTKPDTQCQRGSQSKSIEQNGVPNGSDLERLVRGENGPSGPALSTYSDILFTLGIWLWVRRVTLVLVEAIELGLADRCHTLSSYSLDTLSRGVMPDRPAYFRLKNNN